MQVSYDIEMKNNILKISEGVWDPYKVFKSVCNN